MASDEEKRKWLPNIIETLDPEELENLKSNFGMFDINGDGHITETELQRVLQCMGQNPSNDEIKVS